MKKLIKYAGCWHYQDCRFPSVDQAVCNCPDNLKPNKIIFCDADGVLNNKATFKEQLTSFPLCPILIARLKRIIEATGAKVVLSSTWRLSEQGRAEIEKHIEVYDITISLPSPADRGLEIDIWVEDHPEVTKYAIIDDDFDFYASQPLFQTEFDTGLTEEIADKVILHLNS